MAKVCSGELINKAIEVALEAHKGQTRKASGRPYIIHPIEVGMILSSYTKDEEVISAGILHDTLEDTEVTYKYIETIFGKRIAQLVLSVSEELENRKNTPWKERKKHTILYLVNAPEDVKLIACADKLSNIKGFIRSYEMYGDDIWQKFNAKKKEDHQWYYEGIIKSLKSMSNIHIYKELIKCVDKMFG